MRGRLRKIRNLFFSAVLITIFLQFSLDSHIIDESTFEISEELPPFSSDMEFWADSVLNSLTVEEKVGQMMMVAAYPRNGENDIRRVEKLIKENKVGGVIFFQGTPEQVASLSRYYQSISEIPLMVAIDGEWGLSMRLSNSIKYPKQMMLGAVNDEALIYDMGRDIAKQLKHIGININFAPVVDVNNNSQNPVINSRSFGELRANVARKGILYMKGMQDNGVLAFAKHFPGHGDTQTDSHYGLPVIKHSRERLDSLELYPFRALINAGAGGVMIAHMNVLSLDTTSNLPSTLSPVIIDTVLKKELGFKGLVVTDAMNMKGIADFYTPVQANIMAIKAGNDILLMPAEVQATIKEFNSLVYTGELDTNNLNSSCRKILKAKEWIFSKNENQEFSYDSINKPEYKLNRKKLIESAVTVITNQENLLPLKKLDTLKIASVSFGPDDNIEFRKALNLYANVDEIDINTMDDLISMKETIAKYNLLLVSLHSNSLSAPGLYSIKPEELALADALISGNQSVFVNFANPYLLDHLSGLANCNAVIEAYENDNTTQSVTAQIIFGALGAEGKLPVSAGNYRSGNGITTYKIDRLQYVEPFEAGFDARKLQKVDSLVQNAMDEKAMPGCQILAAKKGQVFFYKTYGYHTYRKTKEVQSTDLYDLASLTKVLATLPVLMKLQNEGRINIDNRLKDYFPFLDTCDRGDLLLTDILLHQAGLKAWIPFYWSTLEPVYPSQELTSNRYSNTYPISLGSGTYANKHIKYKDGYFSDTLSDGYPYQVASNLFIRKDISDSIWYKIFAEPLDKPGKYVYSDLGFYLFYKIIEQITGDEFEHYVDSMFYKPLGASSLCFNPLEFFPKSQIAPTENDLMFRKQLVQGYVHDPGAAMLGGVCGHAGLFGNANDMAKIMQMYLNNGKYGGEDYLNRKILKRYTSCVDCENGNRRGLGFDKPQPDTSLAGPGFKGISVNSYGHSGFTGTLVWADPDTEIVYVFVSNRVYPDAEDNKLVRMDVRTNIQQAIYEAEFQNKL